MFIEEIVIKFTIRNFAVIGRWVYKKDEKLMRIEAATHSEKPSIPVVVKYRGCHSATIPSWDKGI